jgi:hypothetical protein
VAAAAIDLALNAPIDVVTASAVAGRLLVEDVHPGWRLPRIVDAMEKTFWEPHPEDQPQYVQDVMHRAGLCQPREIANLIIKTPLNGSRSWSADEKLLVRKGAIPFQTFVDYIEAEFRANASGRLTNPTGATTGLDPYGRLHRPPLEYYADRAVFYFTPIVRQLGRPELHQLLYMHSVVSEAALACVGDGDVSATIPRYENSFIAGMKLLHHNWGSVVNPSAFNARHIVRQSLGRFADALRWQ